MKISFLSFLTLFYSIMTMAQNHTLLLTCEKPFIDHLECQITLNNKFGENKKIYYPATYNTNQTQCSFTFPDRVFQQMENFLILQKDTLPIYIYFRVTHDKDTTLFITNRLSWENVDTMALKINYEYQDTIKTPLKKHINFRYTITNPSREVLLSLTGMHNDLVIYRNETAEQHFIRYKELISKYPNSRSILKDVFLSRRLSLEQKEKLKERFSESVLQTYWGKEFTNFIANQKEKFNNQFLINSLTNGKEKIITHSKKYTLVTFSASWCVPCHKQIPLLKALYTKQKEIIDFVYISLDEPNRLDAWKRLLEKEQIPWRALSTNDVTKTRQDYKIPVIPHSYLIYPDGKFKQVDIRIEEHRVLMEQLK